MPTVIRIDLRSPYPHYKIVSRDPDRVVAIAPAAQSAISGQQMGTESLAELRAQVLANTGTGGVTGSLAAVRAEILANVGGASTRAVIAAMNEQILTDTSGAGIRERIGKAREEILYNTSTQPVKESLEGEREYIFARIRGDSPGPIMILRNATPNTSAADIIRRQAERETDPTLRAGLYLLADLEYQYALDTAAAQQVVQDAVMNGADWLSGSSAYAQALTVRANLVAAAVRRFNSALPRWAAQFRKQEGLGW